jgi:hypothetical protein
VLVDIGVQPIASVFGIRDGKQVGETWHQGDYEQPEGPPAPECQRSWSWRGVAILRLVFLAVVREDPSQAQAATSRIFTRSLTTGADANLRP